MRRRSEEELEPGLRDFIGALCPCWPRGNPRNLGYLADSESGSESAVSWGVSVTSGLAAVPLASAAELVLEL